MPGYHRFVPPGLKNRYFNQDALASLGLDSKKATSTAGATESKPRFQRAVRRIDSSSSSIDNGQEPWLKRSELGEKEWMLTLLIRLP
jgi:hypothetical protein